MCDYSLTSVKSRPAAIGDKLVTNNFGTGTIGFADASTRNPAAICDTTAIAVCVLPGTEIAFDDSIATGLGFNPPKQRTDRLAIFRQVDKEEPMRHHDALELPDGEIVKLATLQTGQHATVLQLPAAPKTEAEAKEQLRIEFAG